MATPPTKKRNKRRSKIEQLPSVLAGATDFSGDLAIGGLSDVELLKRFPQFTSGLFSAADAGPGGGRPRIEGHWTLAYLAFTGSKIPDVQPWWRSTSDADWVVFGFQQRPTYERTYAHFVRLEDHLEDFSGVVAQLVQHARRHNPEIGRHLHVDSTESETNARLHHICPKSSPCWKLKGKRPSNVRASMVSASADLADVKAERQAEAEKPEDELKPELLGDLGKKHVVKNGQRVIQLTDGCLYKLLDPEAGFRAYTGPRGAKKFWPGYYNQKAICHHSGAPIAVHVFDASQQEYRGYPDLIGSALRHIGEAPEACVFDKGFSLREVYELNTTLGIATVAPWRRRSANHKRSDEDCERYDRHGIPRCRHCGGPSEFVRFHQANPSARLWFRCAMNTTTGCAKTQSINCNKNYRLLVPLWRTNEIYHVLRASHQRYERVHDHWRSRYRVAADENKLRPKRRGRNCQQLRANAALILEWLRILWREGWLGSSRRNDGDVIPEHAEDNVLKLHLSRIRAGLHAPYGKAAARGGFGPLLPATPKPASTAAPPGSAPPTAASP